MENESFQKKWSEEWFIFSNLVAKREAFCQSRYVHVKKSPSLKLKQFTRTHLELIYKNFDYWEEELLNVWIPSDDGGLDDAELPLMAKCVLLLTSVSEEKT